MSFVRQPYADDTLWPEAPSIGGTGYAQPLWMDEKAMRKRAKRKHPIGFQSAKKPKKRGGSNKQ